MRDAIFWTDLLISLRRSPAVTVGGVRSEIEAAIAEARAEGVRETPEDRRGAMASTLVEVLWRKRHTLQQDGLNIEDFITEELPSAEMQDWLRLTPWLRDRSLSSRRARAMRDVPALAEHLANMVTAHDTPRYRTVLKDNIKFLERELSAALSQARAEGAREALDAAAKSAMDPKKWHAAWPSWVGTTVSGWIRSQSNKEG
ncbi:MAG: hypothetical protein VX529_08695 [Pseudomonadota bacterium]|nr:hypothetical protein [Pseudomonadota bacterium]